MRKFQNISRLLRYYPLKTKDGRVIARKSSPVLGFYGKFLRG